MTVGFNLVKILNYASTDEKLLSNPYML